MSFLGELGPLRYYTSAVAELDLGEALISRATC